MSIKLLPMALEDIPQFKHDIQEAFQKGFEEVYRSDAAFIADEGILPAAQNQRMIGQVGNGPFQISHGAHPRSAAGP